MTRDSDRAGATAEILPERRAPEPAAAPASSPLASLHSAVGNAAFAAGVSAPVQAPASRFARMPLPTGVATLAREDKPSPEQIKEAEAWAAGGVRKKDDINTKTGGEPSGRGGFDASYDPAAGELTIKMRCAVKFVDGIAKDETLGDPGLAKALAEIKKLPAVEQEAQLAQYRWPEAENDPSKAEFIKGVETMVEPGWSGKHEFFLRKLGWSWLGAKVKVDLEVAAEGKVTNPHMVIETVKVPEGGGRAIGAEVKKGSPDNARDQVMHVGSDLNDQGRFLNKSVFFATNQHDLDDKARKVVDGMIATFSGATVPGKPTVADPRSVQTKVTLTGFASSSGSAEHNQKLSEKRVAAVEAEYKAKGFVNVEKRLTGSGKGETGAAAGDDAKDRRVDIMMGDGVEQNTLLHEFGHAFGMADEYAEDNDPTSPKKTGNTPAHDMLVKKMVDAAGRPLPGAVTENSDSIMSVGGVIRAQHYAPFHMALTLATVQEPWALGKPTAKDAPLPDAASVDAAAGGASGGGGTSTGAPATGTGGTSTGAPAAGGGTPASLPATGGGGTSTGAPAAGGGAPASLPATAGAEPEYEAYELA